MGQGANMFIYNLDTKPQEVKGVTSQQCMYDNGTTDGSNISIWNNQTIPAKTAIPPNGWNSPQFIETINSGLCMSEKSIFTLEFANKASINIELYDDSLPPATANWTGNIVCGIGNQNYIFSGNPEIGVMILPDPDEALPQQNYVFSPQVSQTVEYRYVFRRSDNGAIYLLIDGMLRQIPDTTTLTNLCAQSIYLNDPKFNVVPNKQSLPFPVGRPIMDNAQLVSVPEYTDAIFLEDTISADSTAVVLRPVESNFLNYYAFSGTVQPYNLKNPTIGPAVAPFDSSFNTAKWMESLNNKTGGKFFNQAFNMVSLPASHDAGMSSTSKCTSAANNLNTQTQIMNIDGQLNAGIRYFDLRPNLWDINKFDPTSNDAGNQFAFGHFANNLGGQGCLGQNMVEALQQVSKFITANPEEIVILKFSNYIDSNVTPFSLSIQKTMLKTIKTNLSGLMYTANIGQKINTETLKSIINSGKQVICIFDNLDASLYDPTSGILKFGGLSSPTEKLPNCPNVYYNPGTGIVYLLMDGKLREVPDWQTWTNLTGGVDLANLPHACNIIQDANNLPFDQGQQIMEGAQLVRVQGTSSVYLTDIMPDNPDWVVLRHVVSPAQMNSYGFNGQEVQAYNGTPVYGPDVTTSDSNFDLYDSYSGTDVLPAMVADQIDKYTKFLSGNGNNPEQNGMFLLSYTLTESTQGAVSSTLGVGSIIELAKLANPFLWRVVNSIMRGPTTQQPPNLVYIDLVDSINPVTEAIYFNLQNTIYWS